jgi:hypothetical protein
MAMREPPDLGDVAQGAEADGRLEALLVEGLDVGDDIPVTPEFWQDLKMEAARLLKERAAT